VPNFSTSVQRTQEPLASWHLVDAEHDGVGRVVTAQEKMFDVIAAVTPEGWRGVVVCLPDGTAKLELNADNPIRQVIARSGDLLVIDFDGLKVITAEQASEFFTEAGE